MSMINSSIKFDNNSEYFQKLVTEAKQKASDGTLTKGELDGLEAIANMSGNTLTLDEKLFLSSLKNEENVAKLKSADFSPLGFTMEIDSKLLESSGYKKDEYGENNPLKATRIDIGKERFNSIMQNIQITSETLKNDILKNPLFDSKPELKGKVESFISQFPNDKEVMMYVKELLINRQPPLDSTELRSVFDKLNQMVKTDYDSRIGNKRDLLVSALHDISSPSDISQMNIGTCASTSIQIQLAMKNPKNYLDMLDTLAQNKPFTSLSGAKIEPNWTFTNEEKLGHESNRTISSKIMQNAIMDIADGKENYDSSSSDPEVRGGLNDTETITGLKAVFGGNYESYNIANFSPSQLMQILQNQEPSTTNPISISIGYSAGRDSSHAVTAIGLDKEKGTVTYINPWGMQETISLKEMEGKLFSVKGKPDTISGVDRLSSAELKSKIDEHESKWFDGTDSASKLIVDSPQEESNKLLDSLNMEQKIKLLSSLSTGRVTEKDKMAILKIMERIFQGSDAQDKKLMDGINKGFKAYGIEPVKLLTLTKMDNDLFVSVARDLYTAQNEDKEFGDEFKKIALSIIKDPELGKKFLEKLDVRDFKDFVDDNKLKKIPYIKEIYNTRYPEFLERCKQEIG